jgi:hypothetical protein
LLAAVSVLGVSLGFGAGAAQADPATQGGSAQSNTTQSQASTQTSIKGSVSTQIKGSTSTQIKGDSSQIKGESTQMKITPSSTPGAQPN